MADTQVDFVNMGLLMGWGLCIAIVFLHASFSDRNVLFWTVIAVVPIFGIIFYFLSIYVQGVGDLTRRAKVRKDRRWEFVLTDKGKKIDPNKPKEEPEPERNRKGGRIHRVIEESPPSQDIKD